ncbi:MAG: hydroxymethylbilane synthase [Pseudomonadota bacterium]
MQKPIVIASRRSPLAVAQSEAVRAMLGAASEVPPSDWEEAFPLLTFVSEGDKNLQDSLSAVGGKGLFVKEVEHALLTGEAQVAVHSMKDMPAVMPAGLVQAAVPEREDPRDAFVSLDGRPLAELPEGATVGSSSVRRAAQLARLRPDLNVVPFRGNVQTRLEKLQNGVAHGTFLAEAGLRRLGRDDVKRTQMDLKEMLPALGQGELCIQAREDDTDTRDLCAKIDDHEASLCAAVERAFVARLDGSCRTPMGGIAQKTDQGIQFTAEILSHDGKFWERKSELIKLSGSSHDEKIDDALTHGSRIAFELLDQAPDEVRRVIEDA